MKKKIIREALGLDLFFNLKKDERAALKILHKKYAGQGGIYSRDIDEMMEILEDLGFNITHSLKIANLYKKNREYLFKDYHEKYLDTSESDIMYKLFDKLSIGTELSNNQKINLKLKEALNSSGLPEKNIENLSLALWGLTNTFMFYIGYSDSKKIFSQKWKCLIDYNFKNLQTLNSDLKSIPFDVRISDIEGEFPIPELQGSTDTIEIPITFDFENITKNDLYDIILNNKESLLSDVIDRIKEIISHEED